MLLRDAEMAPDFRSSAALTICPTDERVSSDAQTHWPQTPFGGSMAPEAGVPGVTGLRESLGT